MLFGRLPLFIGFLESRWRSLVPEILQWAGIIRARIRRVINRPNIMIVNDRQVAMVVR